MLVLSYICQRRIMKQPTETPMPINTRHCAAQLTWVDRMAARLGMGSARGQ